MRNLDEVYADLVRRQGYVCEEYCKWHTEGNKCDTCVFSKAFNLSFSMSDKAVEKIREGVLTDGYSLVMAMNADAFECILMLFGLTDPAEVTDEVE